MYGLPLPHTCPQDFASADLAGRLASVYLIHLLTKQSKSSARATTNSQIKHTFQTEFRGPAIGHWRYRGPAPFLDPTPWLRGPECFNAMNSLTCFHVNTRMHLSVCMRFDFESRLYFLKQLRLPTKTKQRARSPYTSCLYTRTASPVINFRFLIKT